MRAPGDEADLDTAVLFAMMLADICPPVVFNTGRVGWAPTVQLTTYLQRRPEPGWLRVGASARSVGSRFFEEDHLVVDSTGRSSRRAVSLRWSRAGSRRGRTPSAVRA